MSERKIYKTMQGKTIDFDSLRLQNELTPAVGNMRVNARGDEIAPGGTIVRSRDDIVEKKTQQQNSQIAEFTEDFGPEPEITPEEAQKILAKNRKNKPQEK
jgi:hypothetical protein